MILLLLTLYQFILLSSEWLVFNHDLSNVY